MQNIFIYCKKIQTQVIFKFFQLLRSLKNFITKNINPSRKYILDFMYP